MKKSNPIALLPIGVFLVIYLGLGLLFEYGLKINMGFYNIPIVVAFLIALLVACLQNRELSFDAKLELMGHGIGDKNIVTMILIFMAAGIFVGVVGRSSAESVAYLLLSHVPSQYSVVILFVVSCFVSLAMGTSVGTITLITPIAAPLAVATGFSLPFCVASVIGGAMFGDNLYFKISLPAALLSLAVILIISLNTPIEQFPIIKEYNLIQIIPYILVLAGGIIGINVFVVLLIGILSGSIIMLATGEIAATILLKNMGTGAEDMFETTMVAILVSAICALIREYGGFEALLRGIKKVFRGKKGGQLGMGLLVGAMDIATANNTVAIVMANPIAAEMAAEYGISNRKTASILDTFSCVFQGIIPYGAQMLVAITAVTELGHSVTAFQIIPYLFYPFLLLISTLVFIFLIPEKKKAN